MHGDCLRNWFYWEYHEKQVRKEALKGNFRMSL